MIQRDEFCATRETDCLNRGTRFTLSRDELLTLPEFVLLSLFPNGLFPEGHMGGFAEGEAVQVDVGAPESERVPDLQVVHDDGQTPATAPRDPTL